MKRIFTISVAAVMALLMVLSLTACGNSTLGYYKLTSAEASGMSFDSSTLAAVGMDKGYILLKEDGKAKLSAAGQEQELTYDDKNLQQEARAFHTHSKTVLLQWKKMVQSLFSHLTLTSSPNLLIQSHQSNKT